MEKERIQQIIFDALRAANQARGTNEQIAISPDARLYGRDGQLESMGLVALLIDVEEALQDEGFSVSLSDEKAMSMSRSPFRDVSSLTGYIEELLKKAQ